MRILVFILIFCSNSFALEWNSDEFNKSIHRWNRSMKRYMDNPGKLKEEIGEKYEKAINDVRRPIEKEYSDDWDRLHKKYLEKKQVAGYLGERAYSYVNLRDGRAFWYNLRYDWDYTFDIFWTEVVEEVPLVIPLKMEFQKRVDVLRIYPYIIRPYFNNIKYRIKSNVRGR